MASVTPATGSSALADVRARRPLLRQFSELWNRSVGGRQFRRPPGRHLRFSEPVGRLEVWSLDDHEVRSSLEASWR
jgi:hypothetical protein